MAVLHDQPSKPTGAPAPSFSFARSMEGFRRWWTNRAFTLTPQEGRTESPAALRDAAVQFSTRLWDIALAQARDALAAERASVNERVAEANAKLQQATLARGRAENHAGQLEKRLGAAEKQRLELDKQLTAAGAKQHELLGQIRALEQAKAESQKRLDEAAAKDAEQQRQITALRQEIAEHDAKAEKYEEEQRKQLDKAKQHYASLESQLATLLETHKSARQGFEKGGRGRD